MKGISLNKIILTGNKILFAIALVLFSLDTFAQGSPGDGGPPGPTPDPAEIPIDGGASFLIAGGVAYGIKKLRDHRKKR